MKKAKALVVRQAETGISKAQLSEALTQVMQVFADSVKESFAYHGRPKPS